MNRLSNVVSIASTRLIGVEAFILAKKRSHIKISAHLGETSEIGAFSPKEFFEMLSPADREKIIGQCLDYLKRLMPSVDESQLRVIIANAELTAFQESPDPVRRIRYPVL